MWRSHLWVRYWVWILLLIRILAACFYEVTFIYILCPLSLECLYLLEFRLLCSSRYVIEHPHRKPQICAFSSGRTLFTVSSVAMHVAQLTTLQSAPNSPGQWVASPEVGYRNIGSYACFKLGLVGLVLSIQFYGFPEATEPDWFFVVYIHINIFRFVSVTAQGMWPSRTA